MGNRKAEQCPICFADLEVRDCAPWHDCGGYEVEIEHLKNGIHTYTVYDIYDGLTLTLCNFCDVDFSSYKPEYLGITGNIRIDLPTFNFISRITNPAIEKDKFCTNCGHRLKFLIFLRNLRERLHKTSSHE